MEKIYEYKDNYTVLNLGILKWKQMFCLQRCSYYNAIWEFLAKSEAGIFCMQKYL